MGTIYPFTLYVVFLLASVIPPCHSEIVIWITSMIIYNSIANARVIYGFETAVDNVMTTLPCHPWSESGWRYEE